MKSGGVMYKGVLYKSMNCTVANIDEDLAAQLVESAEMNGVNMYRDYSIEKIPCYSAAMTAKESLMSALNSQALIRSPDKTDMYMERNS